MVKDAGAPVQVWVSFLCGDKVLKRASLGKILSEAGIEITEKDGSHSKIPGIVVIGHCGEEVLCNLREQNNGLRRIIVVYIHHSCPPNGDIWDLIHSGASDVIVWNESKDLGKDLEAKFGRWAAVDRLLASPAVRDNLTGASTIWQSTLHQIIEIAHFTDVPVLIMGESGTGKELIARLIHTLDRRKDKGNLVVLDCTTVTAELSGSEFFGHERGAFTGAVSTRDGAFALADGGSLFLDEVGELPLRLQAELLRIVQEKAYKRVGSNIWRSTQFRLICATNRDLSKEQSEGNFRSDFYYRIACWTCKLPPLRERVEDIEPLARHFIRQFTAAGEKTPDIDEAVLEYLKNREYPGNVRDLKHLIYRIICRHVGPGPITAGDIPETDRPSSVIIEGGDHLQPLEVAVRQALSRGIGLKDIGKAAEDIAIRVALQQGGGNGKSSRAAQKLGVTERTIQKRLKEGMLYPRGMHPDSSG